MKVARKSRRYGRFLGFLAVATFPGVSIYEVSASSAWASFRSAVVKPSVILS